MNKEMSFEGMRSAIKRDNKEREEQELGNIARERTATILQTLDEILGRNLVENTYIANCIFMLLYKGNEKVRQERMATDSKFREMMELQENDLAQVLKEAVEKKLEISQQENALSIEENLSKLGL